MKTIKTTLVLIIAILSTKLCTEDLAFVKSLLDKTPIKNGICVVATKSASLPTSIAKNSDFIVFARFIDKKSFEQAQKLAYDENLLAKKVYITFGKTTPIPVADNYADILIVEKSLSITDEEIERATCPNGVSIIVDGKKIVAEKKKSLLKGASDWKNWWGTAGNNPLSNDTALKWPYMSQFFASPYRGTQPCMTYAYKGFLYSLVGPGTHLHDKKLYKGQYYSKLKCLNGYNGTLLWEKKLPKNYMVLRSALTFHNESIFLLNEGNSILELNHLTGEEINNIKIEEVKGQFKWVVVKDDILYLMAGKTDPKVIPAEKYIGGQFSKKTLGYGMGTQVLAYDIKSKKVLWNYNNKEKMDSRMMAVGNGKVYFLALDSHIGAINAKTGKLAWKNETPEVKKAIFKKKKRFGHILRQYDAISLVTPTVFLVGNYGAGSYVALDVNSGNLKWTYKGKGSKPPFAAFIDGKIVFGRIGGAINVATGERKGKFNVPTTRACSRKTYSPDSAYGGAGRSYDMNKKVSLTPNGYKSGCQTGSIPGNGSLYLSPHLCSCNLTMRGYISFTSAGKHDFSYKANNSRLEATTNQKSAKFAIDEKDWHTYRGNNNRSSSTSVSIAKEIKKVWEYSPDKNYLPTSAVSANNYVFVAGRDGSVRCIDETTGKEKWKSFTGGRIMIAPTVSNGAVFVGSNDGFVYSFDASTGKQLWRYSPAPYDRWIRNHKDLTNTWAINTGVIIKDGVLYAAAGIVDLNVVFVFSLDANTGKLKWCNTDSSFYLDKRNHVGISPHGTMTITKGKLWLAGSSVGAPGCYDLETGKFTAPERNKAASNHGKNIGVLGNSLVFSGNFLHSPVNERRVDMGIMISFARLDDSGKILYPEFTESKTKSGSCISPAWDDELIAIPKTLGGNIKVCKTEDLNKVFTNAKVAKIKKNERRKGMWKHFRKQQKLIQGTWKTTGEVYDIALTKNALVTISTNSKYAGILPSEWGIKTYDRATGEEMAYIKLSSEPLMGGICVTRNGMIIIPLINGKTIAFK